MKILSFDAETNGLWGRAFTIGAVYLDGKQKIGFRARIPLYDPETWVAENVLPALNFEPTHQTYESMLKDFINFLMHFKREDVKVMAHMGYIVEARLLRDARDMKFYGEWDAPYPLLDVSGNLEQEGHDPTSVDKYAEKHGIKVPGKVHDPVYDSLITALVYLHLRYDESTVTAFELAMADMKIEFPEVLI